MARAMNYMVKVLKMFSGCTGNSSGRNAKQPLHRLHHEGYIHTTNFQRQNYYVETIEC